MFADIFAGMDVTQLAVLIVSAILIGINKTAIPGIGVLPVIMLTMAFEGRLSTGLQLIMLVMADLMAVAWYRRKADWKIIWAAAAVGVDRAGGRSACALAAAGGERPAHADADRRNRPRSRTA